MSEKKIKLAHFHLGLMAASGLLMVALSSCGASLEREFSVGRSRDGNEGVYHVSFSELTANKARLDGKLINVVGHCSSYPRRVDLEESEEKVDQVFSSLEASRYMNVRDSLVMKYVGDHDDLQGGDDYLFNLKVVSDKPCNVTGRFSLKTDYNFNGITPVGSIYVERLWPGYERPS